MKADSKLLSLWCLLWEGGSGRLMRWSPNAAEISGIEALAGGDVLPTGQH